VGALAREGGRAMKRIETPAGVLYVNPAHVIAVVDIADSGSQRPIVGSCALLLPGGGSIPLMGVSKERAVEMLTDTAPPKRAPGPSLN